MAVVLALLCVASVHAELGDPTRPPDYKKQAELPQTAAAVAEKWALTSVLISPQRRVAIVNGQTVQEGDTVGSSRVVRIRTSEVLLQHGADRFVVSLLPSVAKTTKHQKNKTP